MVFALYPLIPDGAHRATRPLARAKFVDHDWKAEAGFQLQFVFLDLTFGFGLVVFGQLFLGSIRHLG